MKEQQWYLGVMKEALADLEANCDELCALDAKAGDGDHGITITKGIRAAVQELEKLPEEESLANCLKTTGYAMLRSMGGASGPIFSTFFIQGAIVLSKRESWDAETYREILSGTLDALRELTGVSPGDKTMADTIAGAHSALCSQEYMSIEDALFMAGKGAWEGAQSTKNMIAHKGRAKYLGERSVGFVDAGAQSMSLILCALAKK